MKIEFHKKTFVLLGRLESMDKHQAWNKIQALGGYTSNTPRPSSDYIVLGPRPGKKLALVEQLNKPTLTEAQFLAAIAAAESGREAGQEDMPLNDAVGELRDLLYDQPSAELWGQIQALLDACAPAQQALAVDYVRAHVAHWPDALEQPGAPHPLPWEGPPSELRTFSVAWRGLALEGQRAPKLTLGRHMSLHQMRLHTDQALALTRHPDLDHLRSLDLGAGNSFSDEFFQGLLQSEHLPRLGSLTLHFLLPSHARALCGPHKLTALRQVTVAPLATQSYQGAAPEVYDALMEAQWWEQIEGLACCASGSYGRPHYTRSLYAALARQAHRLKKLRHMVLEDTNQLEPLLDSGLLCQLERLSLSVSQEEHAQRVIDHLAQQGDALRLGTLDLSRVAFLGYWRRPKKYAKPPQKAAAERLLERGPWASLRHLIVDRALLGARLCKKLDAWGQEAGVTVSESPWSA